MWTIRCPLLSTWQGVESLRQQTFKNAFDTVSRLRKKVTTVSVGGLLDILKSWADKKGGRKLSTSLRFPLLLDYFQRSLNSFYHDIPTIRDCSIELTLPSSTCFCQVCGHILGKVTDTVPFLYVWGWLHDSHCSQSNMVMVSALFHKMRRSHVSLWQTKSTWGNCVRTLCFSAQMIS